MCLRVVLSPHTLLRAGPFSFPSLPTVDDNCLIVRSPDALRPLTLCDCDCKTAICFGLHRYSTRCIHPAQRCISSRQMTDNTFEVETTALAHVACATRESGIILQNFACAYPSVNHSWIFRVLEKAELPRFICRFLRSTATRRLTLQGKPEDNSSWPEASGKAAQRVASYSQWRSTLSFDGFTTQSFQGTLPTPFPVVDDRPVSDLCSGGQGGWAESRSSGVVLGTIWQRQLS